MQTKETGEFCEYRLSGKENIKSGFTGSIYSWLNSMDF